MGGTYPTVGEKWNALRGKSSGFDYLRLFLSISIFMWHSYQVSYGTLAALKFWQQTGGYFLVILLPMFFSLSGFLVAGSLYRNSSLKTFLVLRFLRIFPALSVEVFVAALIIGPLLTTYELRYYFTDKKFYIYFLNAFGYIHYELPGLFSNVPERSIVNSQLWTVPFELECYIIISLCSIMTLGNRYLLILTFLVVTAAVAIGNTLHGVPASPPGAVNGRLLVLCFLAGALIFAFRELIPLNALLAIISLSATILMLRLEGPYFQIIAYACPFAIAYFTIFVGLIDFKRTVFISSGDFSYGIYLYSCPIQQAVADTFGVAQGWAGNVVCSFPIVIVLAMCSWWFIEKPLSKMRKYIPGSGVSG